MNLPAWAGALVRGWQSAIHPSKAFEDSWPGRVMACVFIGAFVTSASQLVERHFKEGMDGITQRALFNGLQPTPAPCTPHPGNAAGPGQDCVTLVAITEQEFRIQFKQGSPLNPSLLADWVEALEAAPPRVLAIDLDLAPASQEDLVARDRLAAAITRLATKAPVLMVCPQAYSTGQAQALDEDWVRRFHAGVRFARAEVDHEGLYYDPDQSPLGVEAARLAHRAPGSDALAPDWHTFCSKTPEELTDSRKLLRPANLPVMSFSNVQENPAVLRDRIVVLGGLYGISDRFPMRGVEQTVYGAMLHAYMVEDTLRPASALPKAAVSLIDLAIGLSVGALFSLIWAAVGRHCQCYWRSMGLYMVFWGVALGLPALLIFAAVKLAQFGVMLTAAGMVVSMTLDSVMSSHEKLLEGQDGDGGAHRWVTALVVPATLGGVALAVLLLAGDHPWICAITGSAVALGLFASQERNRPAQSPSPVQRSGPTVAGSVSEQQEPVHEVATGQQPADALPDQVARSLWLLAKLFFLAKSLLEPESWPMAIMLLAFFSTWWLVARLMQTKVAGHLPSRIA